MLNTIPKFEDSQTEFKQESVRNEKIAKEICAFTNFKGGKIFFGIDDNGKITGISDPQSLEKRIINVCSSIIHPSIIPFISIVEIEDKFILIADIPMGVQKPYAFKQSNRLVYLIRSGSVSREASREELIRLTQASGLLHYETISITGCQLKELDMRRIEDYFYRIRKLAKDPEHNSHFWEDLLWNTGYLSQNEISNKTEANLAGLLLFGKNPKRWFGGSGITAVCFPGQEEDYNSLGRETYNISLTSLYSREGLPLELGLIDNAINFAQRFLSMEVLEGAVRKRIWDIPSEVLREALVNAVLHRDYTIASDVTFKIFSDRVEIANPGKLANTLTISKLKAGCRFPRNPILIETARDYGYIEHLGMGIPLKIMRGMKIFNETEPEFIEKEDLFTVILRKS